MSHSYSPNFNVLTIRVSSELEQVFEGLKATVGNINKEQKDAIDKTKQSVDKIGKVVEGLGALK